jgi:uncharacterized spore protein YtfJ
VSDVDPINSTLEGLLKVLNMDNVIGEPIESEGRILIPVTRIGMGFGAGQGQDSPVKGYQGLGAGGGAAVEPIAFVVVNKNGEGSDEIEVISLKSQEPLNTAISEISELALEFLNEWRERQKKNEEKREEMRKGLEDIVPP